MNDLKKTFLEILSYLKDKNIVTNFLLFGSIVSGNLAAYIAYFDMNSFMLIDSTTVGKHIIGMGMF